MANAIIRSARAIVATFVAGAKAIRLGEAKHAQEATAILATGFGLPLAEALDAVSGLAKEVTAVFDATPEGKYLATMTQKEQRACAAAGWENDNVADVYNARNAFAMAVSRVRAILRGLDAERQTVGETGALHEAVAEFIHGGKGTLTGLATMAKGLTSKVATGDDEASGKNGADDATADNWLSFARASVKAARKAGKIEFAAALSDLIAAHK